MVEYKGKKFEIEIGESIDESKASGYDAVLTFNQGGWQRILLSGESRVGKTGTALDITVKVSKIRKCLIFSLKSEWEHKITEYSNCEFSEYRQKMTGVKVIKDIPIHLEDFITPNDFVSAGFTKKGARLMFWLLEHGKHYHKHSIQRFERMLNDLPIRDFAQVGKDFVNLVDKYNDRYGMRLLRSIPWSTHQSCCDRFKEISAWFHQGVEETRDEVDIVKEWLGNDHLIISVSREILLDKKTGFKKHIIEKEKTRLICGLVLRKIEPYHRKTKGFVVIEEARFLMPKGSDDEDIMPSSADAIYDLLTTFSKDGVAIMLLTQTPDQLYKDALSHIFSHIIIGPSKAHERAKYLKWNPNANKGAGSREGIIINRTGSWVKFRPHWCCCKV